MQEEQVALIGDAASRYLENLDGLAFRSTLTGLYDITIDLLKTFGTVSFVKQFRQRKLPVSQV